MKLIQLQLEIHNKSRYKDQCDICNHFDYCSGYNGKVICEKCKKK